MDKHISLLLTLLRETSLVQAPSTLQTWGLVQKHTMNFSTKLVGTQKALRKLQAA